jgi:hypothetical protein
MPAWREEGIGLEVSCLRREEERLSGGNDSAQAKVGVKKGLNYRPGMCRRTRGWDGRNDVGSGMTGSEAGSSNGKRESGK